MAEITRIDSSVTVSDRIDHFLARWGVNRSGHRVDPGLYSIGSPSADSPVFVTANYTLSFDALRSALAGVDGYVLTLDTKGINVWCAAGKGTFGTDELVHRVEATGLPEIVKHRELMLPQLAATGVAAHDVKKRTGFSVTYGPVRAEDIPAFLSTGTSDNRMRQVRFNTRDRAALIPMELVHVILPMVVASGGLFFLAGPLAAWAAIACVLSGAVAFPLLLPWLPTPNFSTKGFFLGGLTAAPFAVAAAIGLPGGPAVSLARAAAYLLAMPAVTAFISLNFTGSSTFTSRTGVKTEIRSYFPVMVWLFGVGLTLLVVLSVAERLGG
jgi:hypothetical protein